MKNNLKLILIFLSTFVLVPGLSLSAQTSIPEGYELVDSVVYRPVAAIDSTLAGKDIFNLISSSESEVTVNQSALIAGSMKNHIRANNDRTISGYRVRIFFDNKQTARKESEASLKKFRSLFPEVKAYRIYQNPYFKVTVGDFRTKSEAMAMLSMIKGDFPSAFVIKENIEYPVVDKDNAVIADTIKVLRPKFK